MQELDEDLDRVREERDTATQAEADALTKASEREETLKFIEQEVEELKTIFEEKEAQLVSECREQARLRVQAEDALANAPQQLAEATQQQLEQAQEEARLSRESVTGRLLL